MKSHVNAKTLALLAVAAVAAVAVYPPLLGFLPLLFLALCPLSMIFMHGRGPHGNAGHGSHADEAGQVTQAEAVSGQYVCPMDSDIRSDVPGRCPRCGMGLVRATGAAAPSPGDAPVAASAADLERLTQELHALTARQAAIGREIERLRSRGGHGTPSRALEEAEEVARTAGNGAARRGPEG